MLQSRFKLFGFFLALTILWPLSPSRADQPFQRLLPLLIDLAGWEGGKADGMSMQMSEASMTTATRDYTRGSARVQAAIMVGQAATGALAPIQSGMNIQTPDGHVMSATMHGMQVLKNYNTPQKSGTLIVALGKDALFNFSFDGLSEEEGLALAEKFDWKALQTEPRQSRRGRGQPPCRDRIVVWVAGQMREVHLLGVCFRGSRRGGLRQASCALRVRMANSSLGVAHHCPTRSLPTTPPARSCRVTCRSRAARARA